MEQFSLKKYLENPSRKICTREGKDVEIIYTNSPVPHHPIVGFIDKSIHAWTIDGKLIYGKEEQDKNDLFFADEKEELTEFEKAIYIDICTIVTACDGEVYGDKELKRVVKEFAKDLLNLARKEIEKDAVEFAKSYMEDVNPSFEKVQESEELWKWKMSCLNGVNKAYTNGKQDALKDLPKWKKITEAKQNYLSYGYLSNDEYYLSIQELKDKLPKE